MSQASTYETKHVLTPLLLALHRKMLEKNHRINNGVNIEALPGPDWIGSCKVSETKMAKPTLLWVFSLHGMLVACFLRFTWFYVEFPCYILGYPDCQSWSTPKLARNQLVVASYQAGRRGERCSPAACQHETSLPWRNVGLGMGESWCVPRTVHIIIYTIYVHLSLYHCIPY